LAAWFCVFAVFAPATVLLAADTIRVQGSGVIREVLRNAAPVLRSETGVEIRLFSDLGSTQAITSVGAETAEVAMSTRALTAEDRASYPEKHFDEVQIGMQVVALAVPVDVWNAGVRALTKEQAIGIYEGTLRNWKQLGGEDRRIKFYNVRPGQGIWEVFVLWLYGDIRRAPLGKFEIMNSAEDARNSVEFNAGSMSLLAPKYIDGKALFALGLKLTDGNVVEPKREALLSGKYPLARPLYLICGEKPTGGVKKLFDFMVTPKGQEFVQKAGFLPIVPR
jgi:phosphate transport system substrate-binding protein